MAKVAQSDLSSNGSILKKFSNNWTHREMQPLPLNISVSVPEDFAIPLYGFVTPLIVAVTAITHSFIVIVLSRRHLRTPTNFILLSMAVAELLNGVLLTPWLLYYYTFGGYIQDHESNMPEFWCRSYLYLFSYVPNVFHTSVVWLTVYLAMQRYIYVCVPTLVSRYCTPGRTKIGVGIIYVLALLMELPSMLGRYTRHDVELAQTQSEFTQQYRPRTCFVILSPWVDEVLGHAFFYQSTFLGKTVFVHGIPCVLLIIFTAALVKTIRQAELRKRSLQCRPGQPNSKRSNSVASIAGRSMRATNKMLIAVICLFLAMEIPAAVISVLHTLTVTYELLPEEHYHWMNVTLIFRNVLVMLTFPLNFVIYCSMSEQFRLTVKQLFTRAVLFVPQPQPPQQGGRKRYSLLLVDVNNANIHIASNLYSRNERPGEDEDGDNNCTNFNDPFLYGSGKRKAKVEFSDVILSSPESETIKLSEQLTPSDAKKNNSHSESSHTLSIL